MEPDLSGTCTGLTDSDGRGKGLFTRNDMSQECTLSPGSLNGCLSSAHTHNHGVAVLRLDDAGGGGGERREQGKEKRVGRGKGPRGASRAEDTEKGRTRYSPSGVLQHPVGCARLIDGGKGTRSTLSTACRHQKQNRLPLSPCVQLFRDGHRACAVSTLFSFCSRPVPRPPRRTTQPLISLVHTRYVTSSAACVASGRQFGHLRTYRVFGRAVHNMVESSVFSFFSFRRFVGAARRVRYEEGLAMRDPAEEEWEDQHEGSAAEKKNVARPEPRAKRGKRLQQERKREGSAHRIARQANTDVAGEEAQGEMQPRTSPVQKP